jgi:hypothetical protein
MLSQK